MTKTQAQRDYEEDVKRHPTYHDGTPRPSWENLREFAKQSWDRPERTPIRSPA